MPVPSYLKFAPRIFFKGQALPHYLVFFITKNCTAACRHCLLGNRAKSENDLTLDEIEKTCRTMDPLLFLLITGGDPFLRDDIVQIVESFYKFPGFRNLGMPSNGYLTEKIVTGAERILESCPGIDFAIDISIDGIKEKHDDIRAVPGLFDQAVRTYKELQKLQKRFPNFNLNVAVTVSNFNQDHLGELYQYLLSELGVVTINHLLCRGEPREPAALDVDMAKYQAFSEQLDRDVQRRILKGYYGYPFADLVNSMKIVREKIIRQIASKKKFIIPCYAGKLGVILYPNGDLAACELRPEIIGNLRQSDYNFRGIMRSKKSHEIRDTIHKERCFCTYECFLTNGIMFNPVMLSAVMIESVKIKLSRMFRRSQ